MTNITLPYNTPNADVSVFSGAFMYTFQLRSFRGMTYLTVLNSSDEVMAANVRCCDRQWLLPVDAKNYIGAGNFRFESDTGDYPWFSDFGNGCRLVYYSQDEING